MPGKHCLGCPTTGASQKAVECMATGSERSSANHDSPVLGLQSQVQIDKTYLWLDSKTAIYWIKGSKEWKQFVQNRVNEILSLTEESM